MNPLKKAFQVFSTPGFQKWLDFAIDMYFFILLGYGIASTIVPFRLAVDHMVNQKVYLLLAGFGCLLVLFELLTKRSFFKTKGWVLLVLFLVSMAISSVLNTRYGVLGSNIKTIVWLAIQFALCYAYFTRRGVDDFFAFLRRLGLVANAILLVGTTVSLIQFVVFKSYTLKEEGSKELIRQGFMDNQLFGIYVGPGLTTAFILVCCVLLYLTFRETKSKAMRRYIIVSWVLHFLYIVLSGGRMVRMCIYISGFLVIFLYFRYRLKSEGTPDAPALGRSFLGASGITLTMVMLCTALTVMLPLVPKDLSPLTQAEPEGGSWNNILKRDTKDNISSNRFDIWSDYLISLQDNPVFGASPRGTLEHIMTDYPDSYVAFKEYEPHNAFIYVLCGQGIVGFVILMSIAGYGLVNSVRLIRREEDWRMEHIIIFGLFGIIVIFGMLFTDVFYAKSYLSVLLWTMLGYVNQRASYLPKPDKEQ